MTALIPGSHGGCCVVIVATFRHSRSCLYRELLGSKAGELSTLKKVQESEFCQETSEISCFPSLALPSPSRSVFP